MWEPPMQRGPTEGDDALVGRGRRASGAWRVSLVVLAVVLVAPVLLATAPASPVAADDPAEPPETIVVAISDDGLRPAVVTAVAGQSIQFRNDAAGPVTVAAGDGTFDSGDVPPDGGFVVALDGVDQRVGRSPRWWPWG